MEWSTSVGWGANRAFGATTTMDHHNKTLLQLASQFQRHLQTSSDALLTNNTSDRTCSLCGDFPVLESVFPLPEGVEGSNLSCREFHDFGFFLPNDSAECGLLQQLHLACCSTPPPYVCESELRMKLLENYDSAVPPKRSFTERINITIGLTVWAVTEIDIQKGTAEVFVWLYLQWVDPRLTWRVGEDGCANKIGFRASADVEQTEIWAPDIDLYNQLESISKFTNAKAQVNSQGVVSWERSGPLGALCQFAGLGSFPFDTTGCQFILGPWAQRGEGFYNLHLFGGSGLTFGNYVPTFNEFRIVRELTKVGIEGGETAFYNFFFSRATQYYVTNIIVPTILLTYLAFGAFLLDFRVGERLAYGVSLALVVVAQQIVTAGLLPVSDERLWLDSFISSSFYWILFCLVESVAVGFVYFLDHNRQGEGVEIEEEQETETPPSDKMTEPEEAAINSDPEQEEQRDKKKERTLSFMTLKKHLHETTSTPLRQSIRRIDHICLVFVVTTYTLFNIVMFATKDSWDTGEGSRFWLSNDNPF